MSAATAFFRWFDHRRHPLLRSGGPLHRTCQSKTSAKATETGLRSCRVSNIEAETLHRRRFLHVIVLFDFIALQALLALSTRPSSRTGPGAECRSLKRNFRYQGPHDYYPDMVLHYGVTTDAANLIRLRQETQPDEIYNLAAQSHVQSPSGPGIHRQCRYARHAAAAERSAFFVSRKKRGSTRRQLPNSLVRSRASRSRRALRFIHVRPVRWRRSTPTGSP